MNRSFVINRAKEFCKIGKHRFTLPRERVLSVLASGSAPMGAYKILTQLSQNEEKLKPPTVYRAINFWNTHGFIHRIESMNAYIICCRLHQHENFCVFICSSCHTAFELHMASLHRLLLVT